jgi:hypothetical protein
MAIPIEQIMSEPDYDTLKVEKTKECLTELKELMERFRFEFKARDDYPGYAECGEDINISIEFNTDDWWMKDIEFDDYIDVNSIDKKLKGGA